MEDPRVKQELSETPVFTARRIRRTEPPPAPEDVIDLSDSDDDDNARTETRVRDSTDFGASNKKQKLSGALVSIPPGFLDPITPLPECAFLSPPPTPLATVGASSQSCKQFWKAGDYEGAPRGNWDSHTGGMDHVRVHPKFLHSNATSHKWALGAFAELLDNSLDEVCNGATYVNVDMLMNRKDRSRMLLIEDNGGGMDPDKLRQCMSLGYSAKSKLANTIGQYGNGFKTSTMRLGADVIVFSRSSGKDGKSASQSIGLLSYTFLRSTRKEDIVVPILDYERNEGEWKKMMRLSVDDWNRNVDTILNWSPYSSEGELLQQFNMMKDHGTRVIIFNIWEDDQGQLELDFDSDQNDIQIRGVNRDEKNIQMAKEFPNSRHFLTYRHSLRSYVSILYLRLSPNFRIILRGRDVEHHNVVNDMMLTEEVTYRPMPGPDGVPRDTNMVAIVTIGFVKDAKSHIDVQGFNVYHNNRLIKPFWRVWNASGSDGRGVIGVLEANFVEPAHDKQGFERTTVLARLENKLLQMQKTYWNNYCHKIGYARRRNKDRGASPEYAPSSHTMKKSNSIDRDKFHIPSYQKPREKTPGKFVSVNEKNGNGHANLNSSRERYEAPSSPSSEDSADAYEPNTTRRRDNGTCHPTVRPVKPTGQDRPETASPQKSKSAKQKEQSFNGGMDMPSPSTQSIDKLKEENRQLKERLESKEETLSDLLRELQEEKDKIQSLETKLQEAEDRIEVLNKEQESLIDIFAEERDRRDIEKENLRNRISEASNTIEELREKVTVLENMRSSRGRR